MLYKYKNILNGKWRNIELIINPISNWEWQLKHDGTPYIVWYSDGTVEYKKDIFEFSKLYED